MSIKTTRIVQVSQLIWRARLGLAVFAALFAALAGLALTAQAAPTVGCSSPPPNVVFKSGTLITNETWTCDNVYVITSNLFVGGGVTLTVNSGTIIKVYDGQFIDVHGALVLDTSVPGQPVTFTSYHDDSVGGDTNGDGGGSSPAPGNWWALYVERLDPNNPVLSGAAVVRYSDRGLDLYDSSSQPINQTVSGWTFEKNNFGMMLSPVVGSITATVTNNSFNSNVYGFGTDYGISAQAYPNLVSNTFTNQTRFPIYLGGTAYPTYSGNTFSADHYHAIGLHGQFNASGTWVGVSGSTDTGGQNFPYVVFEDVHEDLPGGTLDGVQISANVTVTLPANTVVKFLDLCRQELVAPLTYVWHNCYLDVQGALNLQSSLGSPITFTSFKDDSAGGDANGDFATTSPAPGDWDGVYLHNSATNFHNAALRYSSNGVSVYNYAAVTAAPPITQVTFSSNLTRSIALRTFSSGGISSLISGDTITGGVYGIYLETGGGSVTPAVTNNTVQSGAFGLYGFSRGSIITGTISSNTFQNDSAAGVFFLGEYGNISTSLTSNTFRNNLAGVDLYVSATAIINIPLLSNSFQTNTYGLVTESRVLFGPNNVVTYVAAGASYPALTNNTFDSDAAYPIALFGSAWPTYSGNTFSNDTYPAIGLAGYHNNAGGTWPIVTGDNGQPFPYVVNANTWLWNYYMNVTFQPGVVIKFKPGTEIVAYGVLTFSGLPGQDTVLTSWKDDSVSGDTNHDGNASGPAQNDWRELDIENESWPSTSYIDVRYSTFGISVNDQVADDTNHCQTFSHSTFSHNGHGLYFFANLPADDNICPSVNSSTFTQNYSGVTLETWSDGNGLTVISTSTFLSNTYAVMTLTRDWPLIINTSAPSSAPDRPTAPAYGGPAMGAPQPKNGAGLNVPSGQIIIPPATGANLPQLISNTIQGSYFPLFLGGTGFPSYSGNNFVNSIHDAIRLGGVFNASRPLNSVFALGLVAGSHNQPMPFAITQDATPCLEDGSHCVIHDWKINYDANQAHGATVSLSPNTVVKLDQNSHIEVPGELKVNGIETSTVIFTSLRDDSVGGDTNADGNLTVPAPGDWNGVYLESSGVDANYAFHDAVFKYGSWALSVYDINANNIFPVIMNNQFYENSTGLQLYTESSGSVLDPRNQLGQWSGPLVHDNLFANNTNHIYRTQSPSGNGAVVATLQNNCLIPSATYGVNNVMATGTITATGNWWGSSNGPSHSSNPGGQGVPVSDHVLFNPWLQSAPASCQVNLSGIQGRVAHLGDSPQTPLPFPGVTLLLNTGVYTTTDGTGNFLFGGLPAGSYTVQPFLSGYSFSPPTWTVNIPPNGLGLAFVATAITGPTLQAQGTVVDRQGHGVGGVLITGSSTGGSSLAVTNNSGQYTLSNLVAGSYTLTPVLSGYSFVPATRTVTVSSNVTGQDFIRRDLGEGQSYLYLPMVSR